jgi:hypothetical protein
LIASLTSGTVPPSPVPWLSMSDATTTHPDLPAIGFITDYASLHAILRARADALRLSRASIDTIAGFADGYASKLLAPNAVKILGERSLGPMLTVLGIKLAVLEDPEALARYQSRRKPRTEHQVREGMRTIAGRRKREWLWNAKRAREAAVLRMAALTPQQRSKLARRAARARWRKAREVE